MAACVAYAALSEGFFRRGARDGEDDASLRHGQRLRLFPIRIDRRALDLKRRR
jgi:hypothetical protein